MRKSLAVFFVVFLISFSLQAQIHMFLEEREIVLEDGAVTGWTFPIPGEIEDAFESFVDYAKERSDVKLKKGGDNLLIAEKISLPNISTKRGDFIAYAFGNEMYNAFVIIFKLGYDISLNSVDFELEMGTLRNHTKEFMTYLYAHTYAEKIETVQKEQKSLEKDLAGERNKISSLEKKVGNLESKIAKETDEVKIEEFNSEISALKVEIEDLSALLPVIESRIEVLKKEANKFQSESLQYHNTIASL